MHALFVALALTTGQGLPFETVVEGHYAGLELGLTDPREFVIETQKFEVDENGVVLAVSDGMGGALAGEVASKMAVESVCEKLLHEEIEETLTPEAMDYNLIAKLYNATVYANYLVHQQGRSDPQFQGMGATFTGMGLTPRGVRRTSCSR